MASSRTIHALTLALIAISSLSICCVTSEEVDINIPPPPNFTKVTINNKIGPGTTITVHCKSKDNDLGSHTLGPSAGYSFQFHRNYFGGTLFFCHVEWPGESRYFDAYDQNRDQGRCYYDCCWNLNPGGPCDCHSGQCSRWN